MMKKLIPAVCLLLICAALLGTSTFAWFSMNTTVQATGMQVQAKAEGGIVITNESQDDWSSVAQASHPGLVALIPVSTANTTTWYHASSAKADKASTGEEYATLNADTYGNLYVDSTGTGIWRKAFTKVTEAAATLEDKVKNSPLGTYYVLNGSKYEASKTWSNTQTYYTVTAQDKVFMKNIFYIKSSSGELSESLLVNDVSVSYGSTTSITSMALDRSLRVAVTVGGSTLIYAPLNGKTMYKVKGTTEVTPKSGNDKNVTTGVGTIPGVDTQTPITVSVYVYFEGEDEDCKSSNFATTLDQLTVNIWFGVSQKEYNQFNYSETLNNSVTSTISGSVVVDAEKGTKKITTGQPLVATYKAPANKTMPDFSDSDDLVKVEVGTTKLTASQLIWKKYKDASGNSCAELYVPSHLITNDVKVTVSISKAVYTYALTGATSSLDSGSGVEFNKETTITYTAIDGYKLPDTVTVSVGGANLTSGTDYTWNKSNGQLKINANKITADFKVTVTAILITED